MIEPRKVKKSQRPRFRGKGLLTEGYFSQFEPIHIPPYYNYSRLLLKETLIPNPINNTIEVSGHFAVSATLNNMSKRYFRPWKVSMGGYAWLADIDLFDKRMTDLTSRGSFGFLSFNFPDQNQRDKQYIDLPIPNKYISGLCDVQLERLAVEKMMKHRSDLPPLTTFVNTKDHGGYLDNLYQVPVFVSTSQAGGNFENTGATCIRISPYEYQGELETPVTLSVEIFGGSYEENNANSESNGQRLVLNFGHYKQNSTNTALDIYGIVPHYRLSPNQQEHVGYPYLQFFRYRYTILLKHPVDEDNIFEYIQNRYVNNVPPPDYDLTMWEKSVKNLILPRISPRKDDLDNVHLRQLLENHMLHLGEDDISYGSFTNELALRERTEFLSFKIRPSWRHRNLPFLVVRSDAPQGGTPWRFSRDSWHRFFDPDQDIYEWIKSKIPSVNWKDAKSVDKFQDEYDVDSLILEYRLSEQEATTVNRDFQTEKDWVSRDVVNAYVGDSPRNYEDPQGIRDGLFYMYMKVRGKPNTNYSGVTYIRSSSLPTGAMMSRFSGDWVTIIPYRRSEPLKIVNILYEYFITDHGHHYPFEGKSRVESAKFIIDNFQIDNITIGCARIVEEDGSQSTGEEYEYTGVNLISAFIALAQEKDDQGL